MITKGFKRIAYADFDVSFRHALRGIHGPKKDRNLLLFLTAYLRSDLAQYFAFHTSANRSMFHEEVHVKELLRLPFPIPSQQPDRERCEALVNEVARIVEGALEQTRVNFMARDNAMQAATDTIAPLVNEYFDIQPSERVLIEDTINILMPSIQPSQKTMPVPTVTPSTDDHHTVYVKRICDTLNMWTKNGQYMVRGDMVPSTKLGIGIAKLEKIKRSDTERPMERYDLRRRTLSQSRSPQHAAILSANIWDDRVCASTTRKLSNPSQKTIRQVRTTVCDVDQERSVESASQARKDKTCGLGRIYYMPSIDCARQSRLPREPSIQRES